MPKSSGDPEFGKEELLYRRLREGMYDEEEVLPSAIDLEGCSVDRSMFTTAEESLARGGDMFPALGGARFASIPEYLEFEDESVYESLVEHCPEDGNDAHCELKARIVDGQWNKKKPKSKVKRRALREWLARAFSVVIKTT